MRLATFVLLICCVLIATAEPIGTSGKIAGVVTDSRTGDKLVGVNVLVEGTSLGASTDLDGYFVILNVPPGSYSLKGSLIGYSPIMIRNVRVEIDQTTTIDFALTETAINAEEVVVIAERPVVQRDVAGSRANIGAAEIQNLPVSQVSTIVGLQAGMQGLAARGGSLDQTAFVLNGLTLRDARNNQPYSAVSLLAVEEVQVQTGGFSAEYGNARSAVVNVVTKEGSPQRYSFGFNVRYAPPTKKYFGMTPNNFDSYWVRPFLDPEVSWLGTASNPATGYVSPWDSWTQAQYVSFQGWNKISQATLADNDPTNDLSPEAAQQVYLWQHRKKFDATKPDYDVDLSFGGPVPGGERLGNLRFYSFFRFSNTQYAVPLSRDAYTDYSASMKVTSDVGKGMKLMAEFLYGRNEAVDANQNGVYGSFGSAASIFSSMTQVSYIDTRLFATDYWAPNSVNRMNIGVKFTHVLSSQTFYEASFQRFSSSYSTNPGSLRDTSRIYKFGDSYYLDEGPYGFFPTPPNYTSLGIDPYLRMGVGFSNARDTSKLASYTGRFDIVSQLDRSNQIKAGIEFNYIVNEVNYGSVDAVLPVGRSTSKWTSYPLRFEAYVKDKLEFEGLVVDAGLRYALSHAGGEWYTYDPYSKALVGVKSFGIDTLLQKEPTKVVTALMPRLNVAFPITEDAKLFFNYGHFRQLPLPENLFLVRRETFTSDIVRMANPNLPLPKTVAYELGYEHNLFDLMLLRISGYYKDISDQSQLVSYVARDNKPNYSVTTNASYEDIRGFEITLTKNRGSWIQGFVNYTYQVNTSGSFLYPVAYQNPLLQIEQQNTNPVQFRPVPQPYARMNVDMFTPYEWGPKIFNVQPFSDWHFNLLGTWFAGSYMTWTGGGGGNPDIVNNLQRRDSWGLDLRVSKSLKLGPMNMVAYMDISNVLNIKQLTTYGFVNNADYLAYMKSLQLPDEFTKYYKENIPGNDRPGDYRAAGVAYQPFVRVLNQADLPTNVADPSVLRAFYYLANVKSYVQYDAATSRWKVVEQSIVDRAIEDKAYIDMPNQDWANFLNPRIVFFGLRVTFDLN